MKILLRTSIAFLIVTIALVGLASVVAAAPPEKTEGFVCPVLVDPGNAPAHSDAIVTIGEGHYTVGPSTTAHPTVPVHATNGNGAGTPPGPHATPGDTDYTAIWAAQ